MSKVIICIEYLANNYSRFRDLKSRSNTESFLPMHSFIKKQNNYTKGQIEVKYFDNYLGTWKFNLTTGLKTKMTLIVKGTTGLLKVNLLNGKLIIHHENKIIEQIIQAHESILEFGGMHESITNFLDAIICF